MGWLIFNNSDDLHDVSHLSWIRICNMLLTITTLIKCYYQIGAVTNQNWPPLNA